MKPQSVVLEAQAAMAENTASPPDLECELIQIRNIVGLATFAVEARRVLAQVDIAVEAMPQVAGVLNGLIPARCQWLEYPDMLAPVLDDLYDRLGSLIGRE